MVQEVLFVVVPCGFATRAQGAPFFFSGTVVQTASRQTSVREAGAWFRPHP
jgi:hypothetical protein